MGRAAAMIATAIALGGCGSTSLLTGTGSQTTTRSEAASSAPAGTSSAEYLALLEREQQKLAAAEHRLPRRVSSPAALSRAISQLAGAIGRLAADLKAVRPPVPVRALHNRLIAVMRTYAGRLAVAARAAGRASGEPQAASELLSATNEASRQFSLTINRIDHTVTP